MDYKEYMDSLGEQIQDSRARRMVLREIRGHIEEQCVSYEQQGMTHEAAMAEAVRQMGDPVETGAELNRIHRPKLPLGLIGLAVLLTAVGILMQWNIFTGFADFPSWGNAWQSYVRSTILFNLIGLIVMLGIMYLDYSFIGRHARLWYVLFIGCILGIGFCSLNQAQTIRMQYYVISLYPIVLSGLIYHNRKQGAKGLLCCMALTLVVLACGISTGYMSSACLEILVISGILLLISVVKDIFGGRKLWQGLILAGTALAGLLTGIRYLTAAEKGMLNSYQFARLSYFLHPEAAASGAGYMAMQQRQLLESYTLWGMHQLPEYLLAGSGSAAECVSLSSTYMLTAIFSWFGIFAGVLVIGALLFFAGRALQVSLRQRNRLGLLLGTACGLSLLVHSFAFIAINGGYALYYTTGIPFLAYGLGYALTNALQVGLLLCVCRNRAILGEETEEAAGVHIGQYRYRLRLERYSQETDK